MALESPTRSWDKQEDFPGGMTEEHGRRSADLDLNQAVTKDEGDDYDYQPYNEEPWQEDTNRDGTSMQTETDHPREYSPMRMEMGKRPRSSGSLSPVSKSGSASPVLRQMSSPHKVQTGAFADGRFDSPGETPPRRSSTPLRQKSPSPVRVRSPLPAKNMSASPRRQSLVSPANYTSASPTSHQLPSITKPISPSHVSCRSPSPAKRSSGSPVRRKPASPAMSIPGSPSRHISASPRKYKSPSPERHRSPLPRKEILSSPGRHRSPTLKHRSPVSRHVSSSPKRRYSPQEVRRKHDRSRSPVGRRRVSPGYGRGYRGRSRSRSPVRDYYRRSPRGRYSPRNRYSPRQRTPPRYRPRHRSPRRRPWSPPPNRNTGLGKPGNNLFIAGFSFDTTEGDLERKFSRYGNVTDVRVVRDKRSGDSRGFGFLTLERDEDADAAIRALDQTEWNGRIVLIEKAKTPTRY